MPGLGGVLHKMENLKPEKYLKMPHQDIGAKAYEQQVTDRELAHLRKKAAKLGDALTATTT